MRAFLEGRRSQLTERMGELTSELSAARANRDAAAQALARIEPMANSGIISKATQEKYTRDAHVTAETYAALSIAWRR